MAEITVDLNRITRAQFRDFMARLSADGTAEEKDAITAELAELVITEWPYEAEISADGVMSLGLLDNKAVDEALTGAIVALAEKN